MQELRVAAACAAIRAGRHAGSHDREMRCELHSFFRLANGKTIVRPRRSGKSALSAAGKIEIRATPKPMFGSTRGMRLHRSPINYTVRRLQFADRRRRMLSYERRREPG